MGIEVEIAGEEDAVGVRIMAVEDAVVAVAEGDRAATVEEDTRSRLQASVFGRPSSEFTTETRRHRGSRLL